MTLLTKKDKWIKYSRNRDGHLTLFCFPYAGAGSQAFHGWDDELSNNINVATVQLPGREDRFSEPPYTMLTPLIENLGVAFINHMENPFIFFGHSFGSLISYELTLWLIRKHLPLPKHLFISAFRAPQVPKRGRLTYNLPREEFVKELYSYNGTPTELLANRELFDLFLPTIRADLKICETYYNTNSSPLNIPVTVLAGRSDPLVLDQDLEKWHSKTNSNFKIVRVEGDHFYLKTDSRQFIINEINELTKN